MSQAQGTVVTTRKVSERSQICLPLSFPPLIHLHSPGLGSTSPPQRSSQRGSSASSHNSALSWATTTVLVGHKAGDGDQRCVWKQLDARTRHSLLWPEEEEGTYRSTLIAQRLKMEAVHSITSMVIRASHSTVLRDHTPPWN